MGVQLIIDGGSIIDIFSQVKTFAKALEDNNGTVVTNVTEAKDVIVKPVEETHVLSEDEIPKHNQNKEDKPKVAPKKPRKLPAKDQRAVVEELIELQETDADPRWEQLSDTNKNKVQVAIALKAKEDTGEDEVKEEVADMFGDDDDKTETPTITLDDIRKLMGKVGKDENGETDQDKLIVIKGIVTNFIPKGQDIKITNIPEDSYEELSSALKAVK